MSQEIRRSGGIGRNSVGPMETASVLAEPVDLVAIDTTRNIRCRYRIAVARDLFGHVLVETS